MRFGLILPISLAVVVSASVIVADVVDVQPPDAFNTVYGASGWLPSQKVYAVVNTSYEWVYWHGGDARGKVLCNPDGGWIGPGASVNVSLCPAASMASASPGTYNEQVVLDFDPRLLGDIDGDGKVDIVDLLAFSRAFGSKRGESTYNVACDFAGDGVVDAADLAQLTGTFGRTFGGTAL